MKNAKLFLIFCAILSFVLRVNLYAHEDDDASIGPVIFPCECYDGGTYYHLEIGDIDFSLN